MITIRLTWKDLSEEFKAKIERVFGDNCNWDVVPMTVMEIEDERDITLDSWEGDEGISFDPEIAHLSVTRGDVIKQAKKLARPRFTYESADRHEGFNDGVYAMAASLLGVSIDDAVELTCK